MDGLKGPAFPDVLAALWSAFADLSGLRSAGGFGPSPISLADIRGYCEMYGVPMGAFEIDLILRLDRLWLKAQSKK